MRPRHDTCCAVVCVCRPSVPDYCECGLGGRDRHGRRVTAPGSPPLTRDVLDRFTYFAEWLLAVPLTGQPKQLVKRSLLEVWEDQEAAEIPGYFRPALRPSACSGASYEPDIFQHEAKR